MLAFGTELVAFLCNRADSDMKERLSVKEVSVGPFLISTKRAGQRFRIQTSL